MAEWRCWDGPNHYAKVIMSEQDRPDPLAPPEGYAAPRPGSQAEQFTHSDYCCMTGCGHRPIWCYYLGDEAEHIGHLCLCNHCAVEHERRGLECRLCGKPMTIIRREDTPGTSGEPPYDVDAGLQRLLDWMAGEDTD